MSNEYIPGLDVQEKHKIITQFESKCKNLKQKLCPTCRTVRLNHHINTKGPYKGSCSRCADNKRNLQSYLDTDCLPVWKKEGVVQFQLPECLKDLSYAEKMLIQRISPFVPLHHVRHGVYGLQGHVVAFEQDIEGFISKLPRGRNDVTILKVMQTVRAEMGGKQTSLKEFRVR